MNFVPLFYSNEIIASYSSKRIRAAPMPQAIKLVYSHPVSASEVPLIRPSTHPSIQTHLGNQLLLFLARVATQNCASTATPRRVNTLYYASRSAGDCWQEVRVAQRRTYCVRSIAMLSCGRWTLDEVWWGYCSQYFFFFCHCTSVMPRVSAGSIAI